MGIGFPAKEVRERRLHEENNAGTVLPIVPAQLYHSTLTKLRA